MRTLIGLLIAIAIIVSLCVLEYNYLHDYLIDTGSWPYSLDWERFVTDKADKYVDYLYEQVPTTEPTTESSTAEPPAES